MRTGALPPHLAVTGSARLHWIVTASNTCESYKLFCASLKQNEGIKDNVSSSFSSTRFRLDHLLPKDWSSLLRQCCRLSCPWGSFTFSSPGDISSTVEKNKFDTVTQTSERITKVLNTAFIHIVERGKDDFIPNNMIYHELQQRYMIYSTSNNEKNEEGGIINFNSWLHNLQEREEMNKEEKEAENNFFNCINHKEEKSCRMKDALLNNENAVKETLRNQNTLLTSSSNLSEKNEDSEDSKIPTFTFYPHRVIISNCIIYHSQYFVVMVNHRPIVPGHLMIVPIRCIQTINGLTPKEINDWGNVIHLTIQALKRFIFSTNNSKDFNILNKNFQNKIDISGGFSIAIQQGELAGQTVSHLHTHIIPFNPHGKLAGEPESEEYQQRQPLRTGEQMREEVELLRNYF